MLPFLVILVIVTVNLGLLFREHQILQNAAREGARLSALQQNQVSPVNPGVTLATVRNQVIHYAAQENVTVTAGNIAVRQDFPIAGPGGMTVYGSEVIISYSRALLIPGAPLLPSGPVTLTARSVFKNLY
jgi:Flp pilus assembly protein TadG